MEPAGLAVGVAGLVGLFSACLDTIKRADAYRDFGHDSQALEAQFDADKVLFEQWGRAVGIERGQLLATHHSALDDHQMRSIIAGLITAIRQVCEVEGDSISQSPMPLDADADFRKGLFLGQNRSSQNVMGESKWRKVSWALRGKERRISQVEKLGVLVQKLYHLVPVNANDETSSQRDTATLFSGPKKAFMRETEDWASDLRRTLDSVDKELFEKRRELYAWVGDDNWSCLYHDSNDKCVPGTGEWLIRRPEFQSWLATHLDTFGAKASIHIVPILWVHGPAGFGKTIMCARVARYLSDNLQRPVAHFFLSSNFASREDPYAAIRSWLKQLMSQDQDAVAIIHGKHQAQYEKVASREVIVSCFDEVVKKVPGCTFILDGLDECTWIGKNQHTRNDSLFDFLKVISRAISQSSSRMLLVSRDEPEIRNSLLGDGTVRCMEYRIRVGDVRPDVESYAEDVVNQRIPNKAKDIRVSISQQMADRCEGQFLWVKMQAPCLRKGMNKLKLQEVVTQTPPGLLNIYERNWNSILSDPSRSKERAISLLRWAAFAFRPLTVGEISEAVLIRSDRVGIPSDEVPDEIDGDFIESEIIDQCGPLLEIRESSPNDLAEMKTVHISHFSVKEFLVSVLTESTISNANTSIQQSYQKQQNTILALFCLQYISSKDVWQEQPENNIGTAFRHYAAASWHKHAKFGLEGNTALIEKVNNFFQESTEGWSSWRQWFDHDEIENGTQDSRMTDTPTGPLWYAAAVGLEDTVKFLLKQPDVKIDTMGVDGSNPLLKSIREGEVAIANLLLDAGASVCIPNHQYWTPIIFASRDGHTELVKSLLECGADVKQQNVFGWTCLHESSYYGHSTIVGYLLEAGAETNITTSNGFTPLNLAASSGHIEVVRLLLENGADLDIGDDGGRTPLEEAACEGHPQVVKMLLDKQPRNFLDNDGETPLFGAAMNGHLNVMSVLLQQNINLNTRRKDGWAAFLSAVSGGSIEVVKLLLKHGADPLLGSYSGWTALHEAADEGNVEIAKILLENKADPNAKSQGGRTPVHCAVDSSRMDMIRLLLEQGGDANSKLSDGSTAFHSSCATGDASVVRFLLGRSNINPGIVDDLGRTGLFWASRLGHVEVVQALVTDPRIDISSTDKYELTPLSIAVRNNHVGVVQILLPKAKNWIKWKDRMGRSLMWLAVCLDSSLMVQLLADFGADSSCLENKDQESISNQLTRYDPRSGWCDVCGASVPDESDGYTCGSCYGGDFFMCSECLGTGATCLDNSHTLTVYAQSS